jgi:NAD(P)-dependent dehydrogenase (short-subunit alcohol dehydrogenase family)
MGMGNRSLEGKTALVTGASGGIGATTARLLAQDGATVVITGRTEATLSKVRDEVVAQVSGARIESFVGDACEEESVKAALERAFAISGRLDIAVATVGGTNYRPLLLHDAASFRQDFEWNVMSAFFIVRHGVPLMKTGGAIVCVSSSAVLQPQEGLISYASSKAALERFVRAAALELGPAQIRVNCVRSGLTRSPSSAALFAAPDILKGFIDATPLRRAGEPEDVAHVVRFLCGPESGWVTGQSFAADGGVEQGHPPNLLDEIYGKDVMDRVRAGKLPA